jgi:hypothetical protein
MYFIIVRSPQTLEVPTQIVFLKIVTNPGWKWLGTWISLPLKYTQMKKSIFSPALLIFLVNTGFGKIIATVSSTKHR